MECLPWLGTHRSHNGSSVMRRRYNAINLALPLSWRLSLGPPGRHQGRESRPRENARELAVLDWRRGHRAGYLDLNASHLWTRSVSLASRAGGVVTRCRNTGSTGGFPRSVLAGGRDFGPAWTVAGADPAEAGTRRPGA